MATRKLQVKIGGMARSFCVETLRKGLGRLDGVREASVSHHGVGEPAPEVQP